MKKGSTMAELMQRRRSSRASSRVSQMDKSRREGYRFSEVQQDDERDLEYENGLVALTEREYPMWWSTNMLMAQLRVLPENIFWNIFMCMAVQAALVWAIIDYWDLLLDIVYNIFYAVHVVALCYNYLKQGTSINFWDVVYLMVDLVSFAHFANPTSFSRLLCYYVRLHRPFRYLFAVADFNLKGSVWGTTAKYSYVFIVLRVTWAFIWLNLDELEGLHDRKERTLPELEKLLHLRTGEEEKGRVTSFLSALYLVNKMFIPIGPSVAPRSDIERIACLIIMLSGSLAVTGIAIASLSLVIALYMRPEETFRARYRLIIKDMARNNVPPEKIERVKTFYRMFWKNQRAASATALLPTFPPTLPTTIYMDIFFEATQKSKILKDLSYPFLSELAKNMETIHYIPGDAIIRRNSQRDAVIYITNGEVEMVTPEDDLTGILRFSKGTILTPCGVATASGLGRAHLEVRAATFCTAHVLRSRKLWKIAVKYGKNDESTAMILDGFYDHIEKVKTNHKAKILVSREKTAYKSSILHFKRCLIAMKEAKDVDGTMLMPRTDYFMNIAGAYVLRNCSDATLTDESDAICLRSTFPCILKPASSLIFAWNLIVTFIVFIVCLIFPYYFVFKKSVPLEFRFFNYVVTFVYFIDLIVHLSTGENVEQGVAISFIDTASEQMTSKWFVLDVLATLPIFQFIGTGHFSGINKLLKVAKAFRVLNELENMFVYRSNVIRFLSYTLLLMVACYLIASLQQGFMCFQYEYCIVSNFTHSPHWANQPLDEETVQHRVTFSLYWAMAMIMFTSHKETWSSDNWQNVIATMMILEVCIVIRVFMEAVYSATIIVTTFLKDDFDSTIANVNSFMVRNQVDPKLHKRFNTYLELCWLTDKAFSMSNKKSIYYDLPSHVYTDILVTKRKRFLYQIPFFKFVCKEDMDDLVADARLFFTSPNEILQNTGDIVNEFYIVKQGFLELMAPGSKTTRILTVKSRFGLLTCLFRIPSYYTVRALTHVQLFAISKKHLLGVLAKRNFIDAMDYVRKQPEYIKMTERCAPFISYEPTPKPNNLMRFKLPRKHEPDHDFLQPFFRLGFFSVLRYVFPRFTIRPDSSYIVVYECIHTGSAFILATLCPCYEYTPHHTSSYTCYLSYSYVFPRFTIRPDSSYIVVYECIHAVCAFILATLCPCYEYTPHHTSSYTCYLSSSYVFPRFTIRPDSSYIVVYECIHAGSAFILATLCPCYEYTPHHTSSYTCYLSSSYVFPRFTIRPDSSYIVVYECIHAGCAFILATLCPCYEYPPHHTSSYTCYLSSSYVFPRFTIRPDSSYIVVYECIHAGCAFILATLCPCYEYTPHHTSSYTCYLSSSYVFPRFTIRPDGSYIVVYECIHAGCAFILATLCPCYEYTPHHTSSYTCYLSSSYVFPRFTIRPDSSYIVVYECIHAGCAFILATLCPCYEYTPHHTSSYTCYLSSSYVFPRFTIRPDGSYIVVYECIHAVCAFILATLCPCYEYMSLQFPILVYLAYLLNFLSYFDIAQRMLIGYFNENGVLIYHPASTAAHYIKGAFITDLFAALPLEYLEPAVKCGNRFRVTRLSQILNCNRLAQLYRLPGAMMVLDQYIKRKDVLVVLKAVPLFMVLINVMTCFMVLYTVEILYNNQGEWWITPYKDKGGSWVELFQESTFRFNITSSPLNIQLATYFWVSFEATTTGYNTFNPSNFEIMRILLIGLICGTMMITYFSVVIISIRSNVNRALAEFQENLRDIEIYMKREKLDPELQVAVLSHFEYSWDKKGGIEYRQVFKLCDQITLRTDVILHLYGSTFANCPILLQSDASLLRSLGRAVHSSYFVRGQIIIQANDVIESMYFVDYGDVNVSEDTDERSTSVKLSRGSIFGNLDSEPTTRCPLTVTASSKIHLLMLNSTAFHKITADFPSVAKLMQRHRSTPTANFILGLSADPFRRKERQSTPMVVTKRRGLVKYLFFQDTYVQNYFILVSLACVYLDMYNAGFQNNTWAMVLVLYALDLGFILKIVLKLSLPLLVDLDMKSMLDGIRREYLKFEFRFDLASCVPIELLCFISNEHRWTIFCWLRLNRMFRIATVHKSLYRHEERITVNLTLMTIFSVFIWFTLFVHGVSCLWFCIGTIEDLKEPNTSWMWKDDGTSWCTNKYLCSLYFVLTTFTQNGVGDIMPKKHSEVVFVITLEIVSTMVYMIYVGEFSNIIQYQSFRCFSFYTKYLELQEFLRNNRVSRNLAGLVNRYCVHLWRESSGKQIPFFLIKAPHAMRLQIMSAAYLHHLTRHHVFEQCEPDFLRQLAGCLKLYSYNEGMYVVKTNEITDSMYLIHKGRVRELLMHGNEINQITRVYPAGSYFGVIQGLTANTPYARTYQTVSNAQVLTLCRDDWLYLTRHFPKSRDEINKHIHSDISRIGKGSIAGAGGRFWPLPNQFKPKVTEVSDQDSQASHPPPPDAVSQTDALLPREGASFKPKNEVDEQMEETEQKKQWPTIREEEEEGTDEGQSFQWPTVREDSTELFPSRKPKAKTPAESLKSAASDVSVASEREKEMVSMDISKLKPNEDTEKEMVSVDISKSKPNEDAEKEIETTVVDLQEKPEQAGTSGGTESADTTGRSSEDKREQGTSTSRVPRKSLRLRYDGAKDEDDDDENEDKPNEAV